VRGSATCNELFAEALRRAAPVPCEFEVPAGNAATLAAHGWLSPVVRDEVRRRALEEVVLPCTRALEVEHRRRGRRQAARARMVHPQANV
jgi:hypothetical protein